MEVVMPELEICSSFKELSILKSASSGERVNGGSMLIHQRIAHKRDSDWCNSGSLSSGKKPLLDSRTSSAENALKKPLLLGCAKGKALNVFCKGKALVCTSEADELNERLRILEEETETMKQELFDCAEERKKLMHDIYQQFQMLKNDPRFSEFLSTRAELLADCFDAFGG